MGRAIRFSLRWLAAALAMIAGARLCGESAFAADAKSKFLQQAPAAWKSYLDYTSRLEGSWIFRQQEAGKSPEIYRGSFKFSSPYSRVESELTNHTWKAECRNGAYSFALDRATQEGPWFLASGANPISADTPPEAGGFRSARRMSAWALRLDLLLITDIYGQPGFVLKNVEIAPRTPEWVAIEFDYSPTSDKMGQPVRGGRVLLDPIHDWLIREYEVRAQWGDPRYGGETGTIRGVLEYSDGSAVHLLPSKLIQHVEAAVVGAPPTMLVREIECDFRHVDSIPESEFTLSAFGLPEPGQVAARGRSWWVPVAVLGALMLILAGYFYQQSRAST